MVLWTIQHIDFWSELKKNKVVYANNKYVEADFSQPSAWLIKKMERAVGSPPKNVNTLLWAWTQYQSIGGGET